jgi:DNA-binding transcriptional MerR regulator
MYSISKLCKEYNLSRSTLLYYDSIGLLKASERTKSNYRMYSQEDKARLGQICLYREAGVALEQIKELLDSDEKSEENVLRKRLIELNNELYLLRLQQKIIVEILKSKNISDKSLMVDKKTFVSILKSSGVKDELLDNLHVEFERSSPKEHQSFLEFLGIEEDSIKYIRDKAKAEIDKLLQE